MKRLLTITTIGGVSCAYMINTRTQFLKYDKYLSVMDFWIVWFVTCILLAVYMLWITIVHYLCFIHDREATGTNSDQPRYRQRHYWLLSTIPVTVLHLAMLHIVFMQQNYSLWGSGYLYGGFFFFIVPVLGYTIMVYYKPEWSVFYRIMRKWIERLIQFVLTYHRPKPKEKVIMVLPSAVSADDKQNMITRMPQPIKPGVPLMKLLFLEFKARKATFYTITGERIVVSHTSSVCKDWLVGCWFVQIRKGFYVNMWHVGHSRRSKYKLQLNAEIQQLFMEGMHVGEVELEAMLHINKDLRKNIAHHFDNRDQLSSHGWEDIFYY